MMKGDHQYPMRRNTCSGQLDVRQGRQELLTGDTRFMTEAELIGAFHGYLGEINAVLFGYISFISGFLIMSYLVAAKLSKLLALIVLTLFTTASGVLILRLLFLRNDFTSLYQYILRQTEAGSLDIPWIGTNPPWGTQLLTYLEVATLIGGFVGCIAYFLIRRTTQSDDDGENRVHVVSGN